MIFPEKIYNLLISNPRFDFSFSLLQVKKRVENRVDQKFPKNFPSENSKNTRMEPTELFTRLLATVFVNYFWAMFLGLLCFMAYFSIIACHYRS